MWVCVCVRDRERQRTRRNSESKRQGVRKKEIEGENIEHLSREVCKRKEGGRGITWGRCNPVCQIFQPLRNQLREPRTRWTSNSHKYLNSKKRIEGKGSER